MAHRLLKMVGSGQHRGLLDEPIRGVGRVVGRLQAAADQQPAHPVADGGKHVGHVGIAGCGGGVKLEGARGVFAEDPVERPGVEVGIQIQGSRL